MYTHNEHGPGHRHIHLDNGMRQNYIKVHSTLTFNRAEINVEKSTHPVIVRPPFQVFVVVCVVYRMVEFLIDLWQADKKSEREGKGEGELNLNVEQLHIVDVIAS